MLTLLGTDEPVLPEDAAFPHGLEGTDCPLQADTAKCHLPTHHHVQFVDHPSLLHNHIVGLVREEEHKADCLVTLLLVKDREEAHSHHYVLHELLVLPTHLL